MTEDIWKTLPQAKLTGALRCARAAAPSLEARRRATVNTAPVASLGRRGSSIAYGARKAGRTNPTSKLAKALASQERVTAVAPLNGPWTQTGRAECKQHTIHNSLLAKMVEPSGVAETMPFLARPGAITGQRVAVDCGVALG
jgi:3-oxoacyl-[acyl-carrier protein] reductase